MKLIIPGGSGHLGSILKRAFEADGHKVVVISRRGPATLDEVDSADVVINLAGRSVNCRYTKRNREEIMRSRVDSTRAVGEAIARAVRPPRVWLQASTATIYAHTYGPPNDENGRLGGKEPRVPQTWGFSPDAPPAWEPALAKTRNPFDRKITLP